MKSTLELMKAYRKILFRKPAKELDVGLVILGTTGRTGLSAVFIGNTAENVIDKINCDVLALKPEGFISPLDPN